MENEKQKSPSVISNIQSDIGMIEQKESIKLIKNTKGYSWEIRILSLDIEKLEKLNIEMETRFGKGETYNEF